MDYSTLLFSITPKINKPTEFNVYLKLKKNFHIHTAFSIKIIFHEEKGKKSRDKVRIFRKAAVMSSTFSERRETFFKDMLLVLERISLFARALGVGIGITFSALRYWQGLYWISPASFPFCLAFKAYLIITKWYFALSTTCEVTCSTFFLSFPLLFLFSGPV